MSFDLSIVIPTVGRASLRRAVFSAVHQYSIRTQVVVVGDGLNPETVLNGECAELDDRIECVTSSSVRAGAPACRNLGLQHSLADYVTFLDDDDEIMPCFGRTQLTNAEKHSIAAVSSISISASGKLVRTSRRPAYEITPCQLGWGNILGPSVCMPRGLLASVGGWDETFRACQDWDLWFRAIKLTGQAYLSDELLHISHQHGGTRISNTENFAIGTRQFINKHISSLSLGQRIKQEAKLLHFKLSRLASWH